MQEITGLWNSSNCIFSVHLGLNRDDRMGSMTFEYLWSAVFSGLEKLGKFKIPWRVSRTVWFLCKNISPLMGLYSFSWKWKFHGILMSPTSNFNSTVLFAVSKSPFATIIWKEEQVPLLLWIEALIGVFSWGLFLVLHWSGPQGRLSCLRLTPQNPLGKTASVIYIWVQGLLKGERMLVLPPFILKGARRPFRPKASRPFLVFLLVWFLCFLWSCFRVWLPKFNEGPRQFVVLNFGIVLRRPLEDSRLVRIANCAYRISHRPYGSFPYSVS